MSKNEMSKNLITQAGDVPVISVGRMTMTELEERLGYFSRRAASLCGRIRIKEDGKEVVKDLGETVASFLGNLLKSTNDPKAMAERAEFFARVENGDPVAKAQFCAARMEQFNNFLKAQLDWINFYGEVVTLGDDEWAVEQNSTMNEITCYYIGEDGTPKMQKIRKEDVEQRIQLRFLSTPVLRYKEKDLYRGTVVDAALQTITLTFDLSNKMNYEFFTLIKTSAFQATWNMAGKKAKWPFVRNSYIDVNNLPAGNDVVVTGASNSTFFNFETLDEIIDWSARWDGLSPDGNLRPTGRIKVPSSHLKKFGSGVTVNGATSNKVADALLEKGWTGTSYRGINWVFIPDSTLPASENYAYPEFTQKVARVFFKPSQDREVVRTGKESQRLFESNEQERQVGKVYGASINTANFRKIARFQYKT